MIIDTSFISNNDGNKFFRDMNDKIAEIQKKGLSVEVKYACSDYYGFSVIIIGRKNNGQD